MYLTFMLRALGYQDGTDFFWNTPWDAAVKAGVLPAQTDWTTLTRGEMVRITTAALFAPVKGTSTPLWQQLVSQGRFTAEQFQAAFPADPYAALHTQSKYRHGPGREAPGREQRDLDGGDECLHHPGARPERPAPRRVSG